MHTTPSVAIENTRAIHIAYNMRNFPWRYKKSVERTAYHLFTNSGVCHIEFLCWVGAQISSGLRRILSISLNTFFAALVLNAPIIFSLLWNFHLVCSLLPW